MITKGEHDTLVVLFLRLFEMWGTLLLVCVTSGEFFLPQTLFFFVFVFCVVVGFGFLCFGFFFVVVGLCCFGLVCVEFWVLCFLIFFFC